MPFTFTALFSAFLSFNTTSVGSLSFFYFLLTGTTGLWGLWAVRFFRSRSICARALINIASACLQRGFENLKENGRGQAYIGLHLWEQVRSISTEEEMEGGTTEVVIICMSRV